MLELSIALAVAIIPFAVVVALLKLVEGAQRARDRALGRQIALTNAIHERLGPVVAPVVRKRPWGPWQVRISVPFARPDTVSAVLAVTREAFSARDARDTEHVQIVLTEQERAA